MGAVEESGKAVSGFIDAMKSQPATLALLAANLAMLAFLFYALKGAAEFRSDMLKHQYDYQKQISDLLSRCVVPERRSDFGIDLGVKPYPLDPREDPAKPMPQLNPQGESPAK